jgi:5'-nucleotidase
MTAFVGERWPMGRARLCFAALLWCWLLASNAAFAEANGEQCHPPPLNILLTNYDGYATPGIVALHRAFAAAGHQVRRVAPAVNHSGGAAALTIRPVAVERIASDEFAHVYSVDATPATTVLLGATALFADEPFDLIVSGINEGANLGPATPISGTVGATIVGLQVLEPPLPGIAVSTNPFGSDYASDENLALNQRVAEFAARLVGELQRSYCGVHPVLPPGVALNVNYPPRAADDIKGVRWARQSSVKSFGLSYAPAGEGLYAPVMRRPEAGRAHPDGDTELFTAGYITVVPLNGDYSIEADGLPALDDVNP